MESKIQFTIYNIARKKCTSVVTFIEREKKRERDTVCQRKLVFVT